ncbi:Iduronate-2-sulfatase [Catenovulum agarivorans DS-2]|uniref:Iduronate-2-sulfatase n=1 Tax=Catenovulum agarivorans DS-2 TaxID=1328313 RepID=W7QYQ2_9ALTE|nr:sulfatase [Catenovulum agarivorans]EWH10515.1 Iduronate-2-sulfatase [Catenovulum agarivorans DS-2]
MLNNLKTLSLTALVGLLAACSTTHKASVSQNQQSAVQAQKQNVVMIIIDDLRPVLGAYGDERAHTPNIDVLAKQGVTFKHAYTNVPVCGASRASMLTGLRPTEERFIDYKAMAEKDVPGAKSLPQVLKESGYYTMGIGKIFHKAQDLAEESWSEPLQHSGLPHATMLNPDSKNYLKVNKKKPNRPNGPWYEIADVQDEDYPDGKVKQKALVALEKLAQNEQPFFLSVGFIRPHLPFNAPKKYYDLHPESKFPPFFHRQLPENAPSLLKSSNEIKTYHFKDYEYNSDAFHTASLRGYYASVSYIDSLVGDVVKKIDLLGLSDNTTIVLLSDHGFNLGEHNFWTKHTMLDTALRIPMIVAGPSIAKGKQTDTLVELIDIFPTITELTNSQPPADIAGKSLMSVLKDPSVEHKTYLYSRFKAGDSIINGQFIFTSYKTETGTREEMMFDLKNDPHETVNIVQQAKYAPIAAELRARLTACMTTQNCQTH